MQADPLRQTRMRSFKVPNLKQQLLTQDNASYLNQEILTTQILRS
jgi:hypothetical protein